MYIIAITGQRGRSTYLGPYSCIEAASVRAAALAAERVSTTAERIELRNADTGHTLYSVR